MIELSLDAKGLIEAACYGHEPSAANRAHVRWRLEQRIAAGIERTSSRRVRRLVAIGVAGSSMAIAGSAAAWLWSRAETEPSTPVPAEAQRSAPKKHEAIRTSAAQLLISTPVAKQAADTSLVDELPTVKKRVHKSAANPRPIDKPTASLGEEAALIARAQLAAKNGNPVEALSALKAYDRRFERGALFEERSAARILALCATGQTERARIEAQKFEASFPRSPQLARLGSSCIKDDK